MVNEEIVDWHADEAAFLWTIRNRAVHEPHYSLDDLAKLDERVEAHLDALIIAGDVGWSFCRAKLEEDGAAAIFELGVLAFNAGDRAKMREVLSAGCTSPAMMLGLIASLGWLSNERVGQWIQKLLAAKSPQHRLAGIVAGALHQMDVGSALDIAIHDSDPTLRAAALRAAGTMKRLDLEHDVYKHLTDDDEVCRFWASWSLVLLGGREGISPLLACATADTAFARHALHIALRAMPLTESRGFISTIARQTELAKLTIIGTGIVGDPVSVPWLIKKMEAPEFSRLAGEAFSMITGIDLTFSDLIAEPPAELAATHSEDEVASLNYESNLPWPSPELVRGWWASHVDQYENGTRHLGGKPIGMESAILLIKSGKQRLRAAAAVELALMTPGNAFFDVRLRALWQQRRLAAWTS